MKKENTKLPAVLQESAQNSGLELSKAQAIAVNYVPFMELAQIEAEKLKGLNKENPEDAEIAKRIRIDLGRICSQLRVRKDEDKAIIKIEDRYIMGLFNSVEGFARLTQKDAEEIEKHAEHLAEIARVKLKAERCKILEGLNVDGSSINVEYMTSEVWESYLSGVKLQYANKLAAEAKIAAEQIEKEKAEAKAKEIERKKAEKLEKERIEIAKKALEEIAKLKKEREAIEKLAAEKAKELQKKIDLEREKREALEKIEADRIVAEAKKKKDDAKAAKKANSAPDIEKVKAALKACTLTIPSVKSIEITLKVIDINVKFEAFKMWAINKLNAE